MKTPKEPAFRSTRGSDLTAKTQSTKLSVNKHRRFFQVKRTVSRAPTTSEVQEHVSSPRSSSQDGQTTIVCKRGRPKSREPKKNTHIINRLRARALDQARHAESDKSEIQSSSGQTSLNTSDSFSQSDPKVSKALSMALRKLKIDFVESHYMPGSKDSSEGRPRRRVSKTDLDISADDTVILGEISQKPNKHVSKVSQKFSGLKDKAYPEGKALTDYTSEVNDSLGKKTKARKLVTKERADSLNTNVSQTKESIKKHELMESQQTQTPLYTSSRKIIPIHADRSRLSKKLVAKEVLKCVSTTFIKSAADQTYSGDLKVEKCVEEKQAPMPPLIHVKKPASLGSLSRHDSREGSPHIFPQDTKGFTSEQNLENIGQLKSASTSSLLNQSLMAIGTEGFYRHMKRKREDSKSEPTSRDSSPGMKKRIRMLQKLKDSSTEQIPDMLSIACRITRGRTGSVSVDSFSTGTAGSSRESSPASGLRSKAKKLVSEPEHTKEDLADAVARKSLICETSTESQTAKSISSKTKLNEDVSIETLSNVPESASRQPVTGNSVVANAMASKNPTPLRRRKKKRSQFWTPLAYLKKKKLQMLNMNYMKRQTCLLEYFSSDASSTVDSSVASVDIQTGSSLAGTETVPKKTDSDSQSKNDRPQANFAVDILLSKNESEQILIQNSGPSVELAQIVSPELLEKNDKDGTRIDEHKKFGTTSKPEENIQLINCNLPSVPVKRGPGRPRKVPKCTDSGIVQPVKASSKSSKQWSKRKGFKPRFPLRSGSVSHNPIATNAIEQDDLNVAILPVSMPSKAVEVPNAELSVSIQNMLSVTHPVIDLSNANVETPIVKRKPGRPRKIISDRNVQGTHEIIKRKPGRPKTTDRIISRRKPKRSVIHPPVIMKRKYVRRKPLVKANINRKVKCISDQPSVILPATLLLQDISLLSEDGPEQTISQLSDMQANASVIIDFQSGTIQPGVQVQNADSESVPSDQTPMQPIIIKETEIDVVNEPSGMLTASEFTKFSKDFILTQKSLTEEVGSESPRVSLKKLMSKTSISSVDKLRKIKRKKVRQSRWASGRLPKHSFKSTTKISKAQRLTSVLMHSRPEEVSQPEEFTSEAVKNNANDFPVSELQLISNKIHIPVKNVKFKARGKFFSRELKRLQDDDGTQKILGHHMRRKMKALSRKGLLLRSRAKREGSTADSQTLDLYESQPVNNKVEKQHSPDKLYSVDAISETRMIFKSGTKHHQVTHLVDGETGLVLPTDINGQNRDEAFSEQNFGIARLFTLHGEDNCVPPDALSSEEKSYADQVQSKKFHRPCQIELVRQENGSTAGHISTNNFGLHFDTGEDQPPPNITDSICTAGLRADDRSPPPLIRPEDLFSAEYFSSFPRGLSQNAFNTTVNENKCKEILSSEGDNHPTGSHNSAVTYLFDSEEDASASAQKCRISNAPIIFPRKPRGRPPKLQRTFKMGPASKTGREPNVKPGPASSKPNKRPYRTATRLIQAQSLSLFSEPHKFTLRPKSTRSPIEIIALRQKQEEAEYDMEEATRLARKLKRRKAQVEKMNLCLPFHASLPDELLQACKPCLVVLVDFVKKLQLDAIDSPGQLRADSDDSSEEDEECKEKGFGDTDNDASVDSCIGKSLFETKHPKEEDCAVLDQPLQLQSIFDSKGISLESEKFKEKCLITNQDAFLDDRDSIVDRVQLPKKQVINDLQNSSGRPYDSNTVFNLSKAESVKVISKDTSYGIDDVSQTVSTDLGKDVHIPVDSELLNPVYDQGDEVLKPCVSKSVSNGKLKIFPSTDKSISARYFCNKCDFSSSVKQTMESHVYRHIPGVTFNCGYCLVEFSAMASIQTHIKNSHVGKEAKVWISKDINEAALYRVEEIAPITSVQSGYRQQTLAMPDAVTIASQICDAPAIQETQPPVIISVVVSGGVTMPVQRPDSQTSMRRFVCTHCGYSTNLKTNVQQHVLDLHRNKHLYACNLCNKAFGASLLDITHHCAEIHENRPNSFKKLPDFYDQEQIRADRPKSEDRGNIFDRMSSLFQGSGAGVDLREDGQCSPQSHYQRARDYLHILEDSTGKTSAEADSTTIEDGKETEKVCSVDNILESHPVSATFEGAIRYRQENFNTESRADEVEPCSSTIVREDHSDYMVSAKEYERISEEKSAQDVDTPSLSDEGARERSTDQPAEFVHSLNIPAHRTDDFATSIINTSAEIFAGERIFSDGELNPSLNSIESVDKIATANNLGLVLVEPSQIIADSQSVQSSEKTFVSTSSALCASADGHKAQILETHHTIENPENPLDAALGSAYKVLSGDGMKQNTEQNISEPNLHQIMETKTAKESALQRHILSEASENTCEPVDNKAADISFDQCSHSEDQGSVMLQSESSVTERQEPEECDFVNKDSFHRSAIVTEDLTRAQEQIGLLTAKDSNFADGTEKMINLSFDYYMKTHTDDVLISEKRNLCKTITEQKQSNSNEDPNSLAFEQEQSSDSETVLGDRIMSSDTSNGNMKNVVAAVKDIRETLNSGTLDLSAKEELAQNPETEKMENTCLLESSMEDDKFKKTQSDEGDDDGDILVIELNEDDADVGDRSLNAGDDYLSTQEDDTRTPVASVAENKENVSKESTEADNGGMGLKILEVVSLKDKQDIHNTNPSPSKVSDTSSSSEPLEESRTKPVTPSPSPGCQEEISLDSSHSGSPVMNHLCLPETNADDIAMRNERMLCTYKCHKCNIHSPALAAIVEHLKQYHSDVPLFACPYCKTKRGFFYSEEEVHTHVKDRHPSNYAKNEVSLSEVAKSFVQVLAIPSGNHVGSGLIEQDVYMCTKCDGHVPDLDYAFRHLQLEHINLIKYSCPTCRTFRHSSRDFVLGHMREVHGLSSPDEKVSLSIEDNFFIKVKSISVGGTYQDHAPSSISPSSACNSNKPLGADNFHASHTSSGPIAAAAVGSHAVAAVALMGSATPSANLDPRVMQRVSAGMETAPLMASPGSHLSFLPLQLLTPAPSSGAANSPQPASPLTRSSLDQTHHPSIGPDLHDANTVSAHRSSANASTLPQRLILPSASSSSGLFDRLHLPNQAMLALNPAGNMISSTHDTEGRLLRTGATVKELLDTKRRSAETLQLSPVAGISHNRMGSHNISASQGSPRHTSSPATASSLHISPSGISPKMSSSGEVLSIRTAGMTPQETVADQTLIPETTVPRRALSLADKFDRSERRQCSVSPNSRALSSNRPVLKVPSVSTVFGSSSSNRNIPVSIDTGISVNTLPADAPATDRFSLCNISKSPLSASNVAHETSITTSTAASQISPANSVAPSQIESEVEDLNAYKIFNLRPFISTAQRPITESSKVVSPSATVQTTSGNSIRMSQPATQQNTITSVSMPMASSALFPQQFRLQQFPQLTVPIALNQGSLLMSQGSLPMFVPANFSALMQHVVATQPQLQTMTLAGLGQAPAAHQQPSSTAQQFSTNMAAAQQQQQQARLVSQCTPITTASPLPSAQMFHPRAPNRGRGRPRLNRQQLSPTQPPTPQLSLRQPTQRPPVLPPPPQSQQQRYRSPPTPSAPPAPPVPIPRAHQTQRQNISQACLCPYCPERTVLKPWEVSQHIRFKHPGQEIVYNRIMDKGSSLTT